MTDDRTPDENPAAGGGLTPETLAVWAGEDESLVQGATQVPVVYSAAYGYPDVDEWLAVALGRKPGHIYSRNTNPTVRAFEEKLRLLEGAEASIAFASGMAAVSNTLFALLSPGDRVVSVKDSYGGTNRIFLDFLPRFGIEVELCDTTDHEQIEAAVAKGCSLLYLETPTNPTLKVVDIARLAIAGHAAGAAVVVDNTFATPINQNPLALGADIALHSATKYLGGHHDLTAGVVCASDALAERIWATHITVGSVLSPMDAWLLLRGLRTLAVRIERINRNALAVASFLEAHPAIERVWYPGLQSHPQHELARRQMTGFGAVIAFAVRGGYQETSRFVSRLTLPAQAVSLGGVDTLAVHTASMWAGTMNDAQMEAAGIAPNLVRMSVGIEHPDDLAADLGRALAA